LQICKFVNNQYELDDEDM